MRTLDVFGLSNWLRDCVSTMTTRSPVVAWLSLSQAQGLTKLERSDERDG